MNFMKLKILKKKMTDDMNDVQFNNLINKNYLTVPEYRSLIRYLEKHGTTEDDRENLRILNEELNNRKAENRNKIEKDRNEKELAPFKERFYKETSLGDKGGKAIQFKLPAPSPGHFEIQHENNLHRIGLIRNRIDKDLKTWTVIEKESKALHEKAVDTVSTLKRDKEYASTRQHEIELSKFGTGEAFERNAKSYYDKLEARRKNNNKGR